MKAKIFNYKIIKVLPISDLEKYKGHHRMKVFHQKGLKCSNPNCNITGTQLAIGIDKNNNKHIDIYNDDFYPLTVDHWLPKNLNGYNDIENLVPMCSICNRNKSNKDPNKFNSVDLYNKNLNVRNQPKISTNAHNYIKPIPFFKIKGFRRMHQNDINQLVFKKSKNYFKKGKNSSKSVGVLGIINKILLNPYTDRLAFMVLGNNTSMYDFKQGYIKKDK